MHSGSVLNVEASDLAPLKAKDVHHRLVLQPVRLILQRLAFEIAGGLLDLHDDRAICGLGETHRLDMRADNSPLGVLTADGNRLAMIYLRSRACDVVSSRGEICWLFGRVRHSTFGGVEMTMKNLVIICVCGMLALAATSGGLLAQSATGAEARLKEKNITLPRVPPPVANYAEFCASRKIVVSRWKHSWG